MNLEDLVGKHILDAVDFDDYQYSDSAATVVRFRLDGVVYAAEEDPDDGYRSCLSTLRVSETPVRNFFPGIQVLACMGKGTDDDVLKLIDMETGKIVLEVGTTYCDSYYPGFVANFHPESMAINSNADADEYEDD